MNVTYVAQLARLNLSDAEKDRLQSQLEEVLSYVEQLRQLDVEGIEPTAHAIPQTNVFREDSVCPSLSVEETLQNAPQKINDLFQVPKVVE